MIIPAIIAFLIFLVFITFALVSFSENEIRAFKRGIFLAFILPLPFLCLYLIEIPLVGTYILVAQLLTSALVLFLPLKKKVKYFKQTPHRIDERNTIFSRKLLKKDSQRFNEYYSKNANFIHSDETFRSKPGLLSPKASKFHSLTFAAANASFFTVSQLHESCEGLMKNRLTSISDVKLTSFIKNQARMMRAVDCGITELKKYHLYTYKGREFNYGEKVINNHRYAIAFLVEMNKEMVDSSPKGATVMESAMQYLNSGVIAVQTAEFLRSLGYNAKAHIDGNYELVCPLVARDAGLGEIGRMGLLISKKYGPRVRISVVTTDAPLIENDSYKDESVIDFCRHCKKCAAVCPSQAIPYSDEKEIEGITRWQINSEACYTYWCTVGTDCARCISVCPYSHPNNFLHRISKYFIKTNFIFRKLAVFLDDFFYGKRPKSKPMPNWVQ